MIQTLGSPENPYIRPPWIHHEKLRGRVSDHSCCIFQFVKENSAVHRKITECLMSQKDDLLKDMLCVVAHGTPAARAPAADLLFYYWPSLNPTHYDRRNVLSKFNSR